MQYSAVFFDLDHTLWDYETNSAETLQELYHRHNLEDRGVLSIPDFLAEFTRVNQYLWHLYDHGKIDSHVIRQERFKQILAAFQVDDRVLIETLSEEYLHHSPRKGALLPHTTEVLTYLSKKYSLTVITNGFEDIQFLKLASGNLTGFFDHVVTSQKAGYKKPAREIFDYALSLNKIESHQAVMIGDNLLTDIAGARNAGVDVIYFNPEGAPSEAEVTHEIRSLSELYTLL